MPIIYKKGNLLEAQESRIAHVCNTKGVMGAGVAKLLSQAYPNLLATYQSDLSFYSEKSINPLGHNSYHKEKNNDRVIINMLAQSTYGRLGRHINYGAFYHCAVDINETFGRDFPEYRLIAIPRLGCGLAGGTWDVISELLEWSSPQITWVVYDL